MSTDRGESITHIKAGHEEGLITPSLASILNAASCRRRLPQNVSAATSVNSTNMPTMSHHVVIEGEDAESSDAHHDSIEGEDSESSDVSDMDCSSEYCEPMD